MKNVDAMTWWKDLLLVLLAASRWSPTISQNHSEWVVYELSSGGGTGDAVTRLSVQLEESLSSTEPASILSTFTLCLWFRVTTFLEMSTLLSYALSETEDDAIQLRAFHGKLKLRYMMGKAIGLDALISPLRWHPMCLVADPDRLVLWLEGRNLTVDAPTPPLPLGGHLVIGQEQDEWDGGYTPSQSFLGQVTGLTMWDVALEATRMYAWSHCEPTNASAFISWPQFNWTLHNQTGHLKVSPSMPCSKHDDLLLFTLPLIWSEALAYLRRIGLEMAAPRSLEEISYLSQIIQENHQFCSVEVGIGYLSWIGVRLNTSSGKLEDTTGQEYKLTNISRVEDASDDRSYGLLFASGQITLRTETPACFTARQPEPVVFYLQALHEHKNIQLAHILKAGFVLSSEGEKGSHFHGIGPYNIRQEGKSPLWCLHETNPAVGTSSKVVCTISHLLPLGTRKWTSHGNTCQNKENETIELILTRCTDDQYTCPDATCIDLSSRCDFKFDCQDRSDESRCATALLDKDYQKDIPPNIPLSIKAYISFEDIREFSLLSKTFAVYMNITLLWFDPWLTFLHLASAEERDVVTAEGQEIWKPHLEVLKSVESIGIVNRLYVKRKSEGSTSLLGYTYKGSENPLILEMGLKSIVNCNFQLQMYPWDEQECEVKILVTNVLPDGVNVSRDSQVVHCPTILDQYHVRDCSLREGTLTLFLRLSRRYKYRLWTTYLPTYLLQLLGYWSLHLPVDRFNERGTMSLTTLLVLISLYTETSSSLPSTTYLKHIDVWFVFNICFLTLIIGIHLASCSSVSEGTGSDHQSTGPLFLPHSPVRERDESSKLSRKHRRALTDPAFVLGVSRIVCAIISVAFSVVYFWLIW